MRWNDFPIVRIIIPFIAGILLHSFWSSPSILLILWGFTMGVLFIFSYFKKIHLPYSKRYITALAIYFNAFFLGSLITFNYHQFDVKNHFSNQICKASQLEIQLIKDAEIKEKSVKIVAEVKNAILQNRIISCQGKTILYLQKDSLAGTLKTGNCLIINNIFEKIEKPKNPASFDYAAFMERKGIQYTGYVKSDAWLISNKHISHNFTSFWTNTRNHLLQMLKSSGMKDDEFAVAASLVLGYREAISEDLLQAYRSAGVMHILCVSGMHVGILFMVLQFLLGFLDKYKNGPLIKMIIILLHIWAFAFITGLSPSVNRAAVMFTFMSIGKNINRKINIYNTLASSALLILLINPFQIYELGFQLSYAAVIGIAALYKPIYAFWIPYNKILDKIWQIAAVSIAAQLVTMPFTIYYFHQFPNYFLLSNILIISFIAPIIYLAFAVLIFSFIPPVSSILALALSKAIYYMNFLIISIEKLPYAISSNISINQIQFTVLIGIVIFTARLLMHHKSKTFIPLLSLIAIFISLDIYESNIQYSKHQLVGFQSNASTMLLFQKHGHGIVLLDSSSIHNPKRIHYALNPYSIKNRLRIDTINLDHPTQKFSSIKSNNHCFLIEDKLLIDYHKNYYFTQMDSCDILLIRDPKVYHFDTKKTNIVPSMVLLSGQLWRKQIVQLEADLKAQNIPFYNLKDSIAFVEQF